MQARAHLIISGRVQGVWFRATALQVAQRLDVTGWVRNRPDGTVEAVVEGARDAVDALIRWCHAGPADARVDGVDVSRGVATGEFDRFDIHR